MNDSRYRIGVIATVAWLFGALVLLYFKRSELISMPLNSWGDFFSGCFAPVAFFWLVLGYLQQGEELRLSTEALKLQADELKHSVEQQRQLVEVSRLQIENDREALATERRMRVEVARPSIIVESEGGAFRGDGHSTYNIQFSNAGNTACSFLAEVRYQLGRIQQLHKAAAFERGASHVARVAVDRSEFIDGAILEICFSDQIGNSYSDRYLVTRQTEHAHSSLKLQRVEV